MARDEWVAVQERLLASYAEVAEELLRVPGVTEVGVGLRRRGGELVEEAVYIVSVPRKLPRDEVPPGQLIPETIRGVPTDVEERTEPIPLLGFNDDRDTRCYDTKVGGIGVSTGSPHDRGTLGCFCRRNDTNAVVLLSCHHVLFAGGAGVDSGIGQPDWSGSPCCTCNEIGKVIKGDPNLDCAIASVSSEVPFFPKVRRIKRPDGTVEQEGLLLGVDDPVMNQEVWKVGWRTGLTRGTVSKVAPRLEISASPPFGAFALHGDSGSVIVEKATGKVIGLLHRITDATGLIGIMSKMADVLTALNISLIPSDPAAVYTESLGEDELFPLPAASPFTTLVDRLGEHDAGRDLLRAAERHRAELRELIKTRRRLTVAWHRNRGPSWLAAFGRSARDPIYRIPDEIDGVIRAEALHRIVEALAAEASADLKHDLAAPGLLEAFTASATVSEILDRLRPAVTATW